MSPSNHASCCGVSRWVTLMIHGFGTSGIVGIVLILGRSLAWGTFGQLNNGCGIMSQSSLSGGFVEIQGGKFWHSPSNCANCFVVHANVAFQHACSFCFCNSCWGTLMIRRLGRWCIVGIVSILRGSLAWGTSSFGAAVVGSLDGCFVLILNRNGRPGGFFGGWMLLDPNPRSQSFFFTISLGHLVRKVRKAARLLSGNLSFITWLIALEQLSKQLPLRCHLAHIWNLSVHAGQLCGRADAKLSFHDSLAVSLNSPGCVVFLRMFPFLSSLFRFLRPLPSLPPPLFLPPVGCLHSNDNAAAELLTFLNAVGSIMWNVLLRTALIRLSNWRIL